MADWFRKRNLGSLADDAAARWPEREALVFGARRWTFAEFAADVDRAAKGLIAIGVEPGEKVALWLTNRPEWMHLLFAIAKVGGVLVPLNTRYRTDDVSYTVAQSDSATLIAIDRSGPVDYAAMLREAMPDLGAGAEGALRLAGFPALRRLVIVGDDVPVNATAYGAMLAAGAKVSDAALARRADAVDPDDLMMLAYTSGTTGHPKGVMHTHRPLRNSIERVYAMDMTPDDVVLSYLPLFHLYGFSEVAIMGLLSGARQVLMETFDAEAALDLGEKEGASVLHGFEAHWADLVRAQQRRPRDIAMRFGTFPSGMDSSVQIAREVQQVLGPTVSGYGMSEVWAFIALSPLSASIEQRCGASGRPLTDIEFRIIDPESGREQPLETPGELLIRGYTVMRGYYNKPEDTAETIDADGWVHSGDMAKLRADGHLVFLGRYKDMLKVGGENVSPAEVEAYLAAMPEIVEAAVVGASDPRLGEVAVAYVIRGPGADIDGPEIAARCRGRIASFKIPRHWVFVDQFPMTPSGKVRKVELRADAAERLSTSEPATAAGND